MRNALRLCGGVLLVLLFLLPLVVLWLPSNSVHGAFPASPPIPWTTLLSSVGVAAAAALLALLIGGSLALLFAATDFPAATLWSTLILIPFVCPATAWTLGQIYCYGPGGAVERMLGDGVRPFLETCNQGHYASTVAVLTQIYTPIAMLFLWRGMARLHHAGFEAACLFLSPRRRWFWLLRVLRKELAATVALVFAMCLGNFAVPHVLQCRLYVIDIYMRTANYLDHDGAVRAAVPLVLLSLTAVGGVLYLDSRSPRIRGGPVRHWRIPLGNSGWAIGGVLALYVTLTVVLPVGAMISECDAVAFFLKAVRESAPETSNTLLIGAMAAVVTVVAGLGTQALPAGALRAAGHSLAFATLGLPALLVALAYVRTFTTLATFDIPAVDAVRGTGMVVVIALGFRAWPFMARLMANANRQRSPAWREAAELSQMPTLKQWRWITLPLSFDYLISGAIIAYVIAASDVVICQMLCEPGQGTLALRLFTYLHFGPSYVAASLALLHLLVTCIPVLVYFLVADRCLRVV